MNNLADMTDLTVDLPSLLGSRICHDLISPLGAIANGVELIALSHVDKSPELALITQSVSSATARIRFFRVAFGLADGGQWLARAEVISILSGMAPGGRVTFEWLVGADLPRCRVKLAFLAMLCLETALPWGGHIVVREGPDGLLVSAEAERMKVDAALWDPLRLQLAPERPAAAQVQFALLPDEMHRQRRSIGVTVDPQRITLRI